MDAITVERRATLTVPVDQLAQLLARFAPLADWDDNQPHPWDPYAGEPQPIPWKWATLARAEVERLVNEVRTQLLQLKMTGEVAGRPQPMAALGAWIDDEVDGWCGATPVHLPLHPHFPLAIARGQDLALRGALLSLASRAIADATLQEHFEKGAARLFSLSFDELARPSRSA